MFLATVHDDGIKLEMPIRLNGHFQFNSIIIICQSLITISAENQNMAVKVL